jgi:hypothetical protein
MNKEVHNAHMRIPKDLWDRARKEATKGFHNMTQFTVMALEQALKRRKKSK